MRAPVLIFLLIGLLGPVFAQNVEGMVHWTVRFEKALPPETKEPKSKATEDREQAGLEPRKDFFPKGITLTLKNGNARLSHQGGPLDGNVVLRLVGRPGHLQFNTNSPGTAWAFPPSTPTPAAIARIKITRTEETGSILGLPTRKYVVITQAFGPVKEMTITVWTTTALPGADAKLLMDLQLSQGEAVYLPQIEGLPLKMEYRGPATEGLEFVLEADRVDRLQLADELFRIPVGYTEKVVEPRPSLVRPPAGTVP